MELKNIAFTPLKKINVDGGDIFHGIKKNDLNFNGFGELYFSWINPFKIKAWKKHRLMTMNLLVPVGNVKFLFANEDFSKYKKFEIGTKNYGRLTIPPGIWFGFQCTHKEASLVANLSNILHDDNEIERMSINEKPFLMEH